MRCSTTQDLQNLSIRMVADTGPLLDLLQAYYDEFHLQKPSRNPITPSAPNDSDGEDIDAFIDSLPESFCATNISPDAVGIFRTSKARKLPAWEVSLIKFNSGADILTIATNQDSGKSIQVETVMRHIMQSLRFRKVVNLKRLARGMIFLSFPIEALNSPSPPYISLLPSSRMSNVWYPSPFARGVPRTQEVSKLQGYQLQKWCLLG